MTINENALSRFMAKVDRNSGDCWEWTAGKVTNGYGLFHVGDGTVRKTMAHRWSYENFVGPIPQGMQIDHLCRNRSCVNPQHLEPVSNRENGIRGYASRRQGIVQKCAAGHELIGSNVYGEPPKTRCRLCNNTKNAARNRARRASAK